MNNQNVPEDWGQDSLTAFIDLANRNSYGVFVQYTEWFTRLQKVDAVFEQFTKDFINPPSFFEPFLFIRAHSGFRGAVRLSTSGQLPEAYSIARGGLESALYGFYFHKSPTTVEAWLKRDDSEAERKQALKELNLSTMVKELAASEAEIGRVASHLYEFTIDAGAHPNRKTITIGMEQTGTDEHVTFNLTQLNVDTDPLVLCLKTTA